MPALKLAQNNNLTCKVLDKRQLKFIFLRKIGITSEIHFYENNDNNHLLSKHWCNWTYTSTPFSWVFTVILIVKCQYPPPPQTSSVVSGISWFINFHQYFTDNFYIIVYSDNILWQYFMTIIFLATQKLEYLLYIIHK